MPPTEPRRRGLAIGLAALVYLTGALTPAGAQAATCPLRVTLGSGEPAGNTNRIKVSVGQAGSDAIRWRTRSTAKRQVVMCQVRQHIFIPPFDPEASVTSYFWTDFPTGRSGGRARIDQTDIPEGWDSFVSFTARYASKRR